jgi:hypothetical protein
MSRIAQIDADRPLAPLLTEALRYPLRKAVLPDLVALTLGHYLSLFTGIGWLMAMAMAMAVSMHVAGSGWLVSAGVALVLTTIAISLAARLGMHRVALRLCRGYLAQRPRDRQSLCRGLLATRLLIQHPDQRAEANSLLDVLASQWRGAPERTQIDAARHHLAGAA